MSMRGGWCVIGIWVWCWCVVLASPGPQCPSTGATERCVSLETYELNNYHYLIDGENLIVRINGEWFELTCEGNMTLDSPVLPRYDTLTNYRNIAIIKCPTPQHSYSDALRALNVNTEGHLLIESAVGEVTRSHLSGLNHLRSLHFAYLRLSDDAFKATPDLKYLYLESVNPPPTSLLPKSLKELQITRPGKVQLDGDALTNLTNLTSLVVREDVVNVRVKAAKPLKIFSATAEYVFLDPELPDTLTEVVIHGWGEILPVRWQSCKALEVLNVSGARAETLPDDWLANCQNLRHLKLYSAHALISLAPRAFRGASALEHLELTNCAVQELPAELLYDAVRLQFLDLSRNFIHSLRSDFFVKSYNLWELNLSNNNLTSEVLRAVSTATSLGVLNLNNNMVFAADNACEQSLWQELKNLSKLYLRNTSAQYICTHLRTDLPKLTYLDLSENNIIGLTYADLEYTKYEPIIVNLTKNPVTHLIYNVNDYLKHVNDSNCKYGNSHTSSQTASRVTVELSSYLQCGCKEAWAALAFQTCPNHVTLEGAVCTDRTGLADISLKKLGCTFPPMYCNVSAPCLCQQYLQRENPLRMLRVTCENANLTQLPILPRYENVTWELHLAHNNITTPRAKDLPSNLVELDLRYNNLTKVDSAISLLDERRRLRLSGNKFDCACGTERALEKLRARPTRVEDFHDLVCSNGAALIVTADCKLSDSTIMYLLVALTPLLLAVIVLISCLVRFKTRSQLKATLRRYGWLPRLPEPDDKRPYDVFLSFSHQDFNLVQRIQEWLENGKEPYRVLVHYRDWLPGGWIPTQIEASVRRSRRTVAVVSANFLESSWARAEFRLAYGAALRDDQPRLVVILLDDPSHLKLDSELARYLTANTYIKWGDPWFWKKLRAALPPPRGHSTASTDGDASTDPLMLELSPRTPAAEAVAEAMMEAVRVEPNVTPKESKVVEAVVETMQRNHSTIQD